MHNTGIYEIRNLVNGKRYVGSAVHFRYRWTKHLSELKRGVHHSSHLQRAWNKHGAAAFEFHRLIVCDKANLVTYEQICLDAYQPEYNICRKAYSAQGVKRTPEAIAKTVASRKANGGWSPSAETRAKISETLKGRPGRKHSTESLEKMRDAQRKPKPWMQGMWDRKIGVPRNPDVKAKLGRANAKLSDQTVVEIRARYAAGELQKELAAEFGIKQPSMSELLRGISYAWVK